MSISRKFACALAFFAVGAAFCGAQTITTADTFFSSVSEAYAKITDFSANIEIVSTSGAKSQSMKGRSVFKTPKLLRIDFSDPDEQTIVFDGDMLTIYLPAYNVVLSQSVEGNSTSSGASLATPEGLSLMKRYYTIAYETGPDPVPVEANSKESVVVLALSRRYTTEMFRTIRLMISPDTKLIRRIEATTVTGDTITFNFTGYSLNQGILDNRFLYESPASANVFNDFLFNEE
jgi:outer membrane lipoprotein carrier protein